MSQLPTILGNSNAKEVITEGASALIMAVESGIASASLAAKLIDECDDKKEQACRNYHPSHDRRISSR